MSSKMKRVVEMEKELEAIRQELAEIKELLKELIYITAVGATETIQITENTSAMLRGEVPKSCSTAHLRLREDITELTDKSLPEKSSNLKKHLFGHD